MSKDHDHHLMDEIERLKGEAARAFFLGLVFGSIITAIFTVLTYLMSMEGGS